LQVPEDAREACHRENAVGQKMAQQGDCPKGCGIVVLLLEASGTRADVSGRGGLFGTDDRVFKDRPVVFGDEAEPPGVPVMPSQVQFPETVRTNASTCCASTDPHTFVAIRGGRLCFGVSRQKVQEFLRVGGAHPIQFEPVFIITSSRGPPTDTRYFRIVSKDTTSRKMGDH